MAAQVTQPAEETLHHLTRLSQKPGVQSTLILSRETGAIVRASGLLVSDTPTTPADGTNGDDSSNRANEPLSPKKDQDGDDANADGKPRSAEDVARSVWKFFAAAGGMVDEMRGEGEDEVKLVRLRMRRCEVVVVPDAKFLLVVIHDTPPA